jgi:hypothetical protein
MKRWMRGQFRDVYESLAVVTTPTARVAREAHKPRSGSSSTFVLMDEAAQDVASSDTCATRPRRGRGPVVGCQQAEPSVRSCVVVMLRVGAKDTFEMAPPSRKQPVQALGTGRPRPAFRERVRSRCSYRSLHDLHAFACLVLRKRLHHREAVRLHDRDAVAVARSRSLRDPHSDQVTLPSYKAESQLEAFARKRRVRAQGRQR